MLAITNAELVLRDHLIPDGMFFSDDSLHAARQFLRHGTTIVLSALHFSMDTHSCIDAIGKIKSAMREPDGALGHSGNISNDPPKAATIAPIDVMRAKGVDRGARAGNEGHVLELEADDEPSGHPRAGHAVCAELDAADEEDAGLHLRQVDRSLLLLGEDRILSKKQITLLCIPPQDRSILRR